MESRLRQIRIAKPSSPVWLVTEAFVTKWNQRIVAGGEGNCPGGEQFGGICPRGKFQGSVLHSYRYYILRKVVFTHFTAFGEKIKII